MGEKAQPKCEPKINAEFDQLWTTRNNNKQPHNDERRKKNNETSERARDVN